MRSSVKDVLLVGCGKMGSALAQGWLEQKILDNLTIVEPREISISDPRVVRLDTPESIESTPEMIALAVKPQALEEVLPFYRRFVSSETIFVSIAAGKSVDYCRALLGSRAIVTRTMPNLPAAVGRGMTVGFAPPTTLPSHREKVERLFRAVGDWAWVDPEELLDPITALSGSGPAYIFLLVEILSRIGVAHGLSPELSTRLARSIAIGGGALLQASADSAEDLRRGVTSPGGATEAALTILSHPLESLFHQALQAAVDRSRTL